MILCLTESLSVNQSFTNRFHAIRRQQGRVGLDRSLSHAMYNGIEGRVEMVGCAPSHDTMRPYEVKRLEKVGAGGSYPMIRLDYLCRR